MVGSRRLLDLLLKWIRQDSDRPLFAFANITNVHHAWAVPPDILLSQLKLNIRHVGNSELFDPRPFDVNTGKIEITPRHRQIWNSMYDAAIIHADREIGRFLRNLGEWDGFVDAAFFWNEYQDMIEFTFGVYPDDSTSIPTLDDVGFKSLNVSDARITGIDILLGGAGFWGKTFITFYTGYTYMHPYEINSEQGEDQILKYRYRHSLKGDLEVKWKKLSGGLNMIFNSPMERIDEAFEEELLPGIAIFPGLKEYRLENDRGFFVFDLRAGFQITRASKLSFIIKNLFNKEYMGRPGDIQPPRNITLQYNLGI